MEHQTQILYDKFREVRIHSTVLFPAELSRHVMVNRKEKQRGNGGGKVFSAVASTEPTFFLVHLFNLSNFIKQMLFLFTFLLQIRKMHRDVKYIGDIFTDVPKSGLNFGLSSTRSQILTNGHHHIYKINTVHSTFGEKQGLGAWNCG